MAYLDPPAVHSARRAVAVQCRAPVRVFRQARAATVCALQRLPESAMQRQEFVFYIGVDGTELCAQSEDLRVRAGCVAVAPHVRHSVAANGGAFVQIAINPRHPTYRQLRACNGPSLAQLNGAHFLDLQPRLAELFVATGMHDYEFALLVEDALDLVLPGGLAPLPQDDRVRDVLRRIDADIHHPFEALMRELGLSASRLSHLVSEQLGMSLRSYKLWRRAELAWELALFKPQWRLARVASEAGFSDQSHMARTMLQSFGFTASQLRDPLQVQVVHNWS